MFSGSPTPVSVWFAYKKIAERVNALRDSYILKRNLGSCQQNGHFTLMRGAFSSYYTQDFGILISKRAQHGNPSQALCPSSSLVFLANRSAIRNARRIAIPSKHSMCYAIIFSRALCEHFVNFLLISSFSCLFFDEHSFMPCIKKKLRFI